LRADQKYNQNEVVNVVVQDESKTANETAKNRHAVITYCDVYGGIYLHVDHIRFIMLCLQQSDPSGPVYVSYNINKYTPPFFRTCTLQMYIIIIIVERMLDYRFIIANQEPRKTVLLRRTWGRINISLSVFNIYRSVHINKYIFNIIINDICPAGVINDDVDPPRDQWFFFSNTCFARSKQITHYPNYKDTSTWQKCVRRTHEILRCRLYRRIGDSWNVPEHAEL